MGLDGKLLCAMAGMAMVTAPAKPAQPLTDEQILRLVPGLEDCLGDPYDSAKTGDEYSSIPADMIRLARAIEAHIKGEQA